MTENEWEPRWEACERALLVAADSQLALGGEDLDRELVTDFVEQGDFTSALLFGTELIREGDERPEARALAELLIPQVEFLLEAETERPTDPSPAEAYLSTLERLRGVSAGDR